MFVANLLTIESLTDHQLDTMHEDEEPLSREEENLLKHCGDDLMLFRLKGPLSFGAAKGISERMMLVRQYRILLLDITNVPHLGVTASLAIERMVQEAAQHDREVLVAGATGKVKRRLQLFGIPSLVDTRLEALREAEQRLNS